ncbi:hypothetical protein ABZP36_027729 [Zizania latifolia]
MAVLCPPQWEIRWVWDDYYDSFSEEDWFSFQYAGRSVVLLRTKLVHLLGLNLTLCVRAGRHGQSTPLLVDLPHSREPLHIVAIKANTRGDQLIFPDVDVEPADAAEGDELRIG